MDISHQDLLSVLKSELVTSIGCTEPAAVALACAKAKEHLNDELDHLNVLVSRDVFKNGFKVGIPGTEQRGLLIAIALGYLFGNPDAGLEVLQSVGTGALGDAESLVLSGRITIDIDQDYDGLFIQVNAKGITHEALVIIKEEHNHIARIEVDGAVLLEDQPDEASGRMNASAILDALTPEAIVRFADTVDIHEIMFVYEAAEINARAAREGMSNSWGLNIGKTLMALDDGDAGEDDSRLTISRITRAAAFAAAASDARMSGCSCPIVINSGSGNQGITASLPVLSIARDMGIDKQLVMRALVMSHLLSLYQKHFSDRISAFCGVVTAAVGAGCAAAYMLGGGLVEIEHTMNTALGGISGMICDGAKSSCAMKIALAVQNALIACAVGLQGKGITPGEGIVGADAHGTVKNIGRLATEGMRGTDEVILQIMLDTSE